MKKISALLLACIFAVSIGGCGQQKPVDNEILEEGDEPIVVEEVEEVEGEDTLDYIGYWLRTAVYADGELVNTVPAALDLKADSYFSMGTCENGGRVIYHGGNSIELTLDSTNCPGVTAGGSVVYTYEIRRDAEGKAKNMVLRTGNSMETFDLQEV